MGPSGPLLRLEVGTLVELFMEAPFGVYKSNPGGGVIGFEGGPLAVGEFLSRKKSFRDGVILTLTHPIDLDENSSEGKPFVFGGGVVAFTCNDAVARCKYEPGPALEFVILTDCGDD